MIALVSIIVFLGCIVAGSSFQQNLVLDGVSLPVNITPSAAYFPAQSAKYASFAEQFLGNYSSDILSVIGKSKNDPATYKVFEDLHRHYVDLKVKPDLPDGYLFFGENKNYENAPYILKNNAFFFASLRSGPDMTYEIDPFGKRGTTYFSQLTACLTNKQPRVGATFDSRMNIIKMKVYNATNPKKELTGYTREQAATLLLYQCAYFAQSVHIVDHVSIQVPLQLNSILLITNFSHLDSVKHIHHRVISSNTIALIVSINFRSTILSCQLLWIMPRQTLRSILGLGRTCTNSISFTS
jgi:hypothetical protein